VALITVLSCLLVACSREQQDWRSAEAADTSEAYGRFVEQHRDSELATQARTRIAQLAEERDWKHASGVATLEAYREFLGQHPSGKWSEEARIRIEGFSLGSAPRTGPKTAVAAASPQGPAGVSALQLARGTAGRAPLQPAAPATGVKLAQASPAEVSAAAARSPTPRAGFGVQLGAFGSEASADREWQRLQGRFGAQLRGLSPRIVPGRTAAGEVYRLQAPAAGEAQARALCDSLKQQSQACVPVLPR
jgi:hypothetical protein